MKPLISVIVPIFNTVEYLQECLDSIVSQTYSNLEIIVVDDGSTDGSNIICDEYVEKDNRIKVLHKQNDGLVSARKSGFELSHGEFIAFVDSDDWIDENMIASLYELIEESSSDIAISAVNIFAENTSAYKSNVASPGVYKDEELPRLKSVLFGGEEYFSFSVLPYLWNKLWKRSIIEENLLPVDESITIGEDVAIGFPAMMQANSLVITDKAYYHYRQSENSMLKTVVNEQQEYENAKRLYTYLCQRYKNIGCYEQTQNGLEKYYIHQLFTRAYGHVCHGMSIGGCFPFFEHLDKPVIIYGAGSFGSAVYKYLKNKIGVKTWIDGNAGFLRGMGYPVVGLDEVEFEDNDIIIVPIFVARIAEEIRHKLISAGLSEKQILSFHLTQEQEKELLEL